MLLVWKPYELFVNLNFPTYILALPILRIIRCQDSGESNGTAPFAEHRVAKIDSTLVISGRTISTTRPQRTTWALLSADKPHVGSRSFTYGNFFLHNPWFSFVNDWLIATKRLPCPPNLMTMPDTSVSYSKILYHNYRSICHYCAVRCALDCTEELVGTYTNLDIPGLARESFFCSIQTSSRKLTMVVYSNIPESTHNKEHDVSVWKSVFSLEVSDV